MSHLRLVPREEPPPRRPSRLRAAWRRLRLAVELLGWLSLGLTALVLMVT